MKRALPLLFFLTACQAAAPEAQAPAGARIACAVAGADAFSKNCEVVRVAREGETILTLIAPDGGFRRVAVSADGSAITAADGAQPARTGKGPGDEIEISIARDRYRLPAMGSAAGK